MTYWLAFWYTIVARGTEDGTGSHRPLLGDAGMSPRPSPFIMTKTRPMLFKHLVFHAHRNKTKGASNGSLSCFYSVMAGLAASWYGETKENGLPDFFVFGLRQIRSIAINRFQAVYRYTSRRYSPDKPRKPQLCHNAIITYYHVLAYTAKFLGRIITICYAIVPNII